ncbi:BMP family lipoprotein [Virgibacillus oceani]|uniref:BMP family ABC transporter substrate-binding protein n=1 Tax=Virgibacillus oceani TaxID=1479511 RepID=A0A917LXW5_9BACI|nr:BMP family ABC transporter substrate-binding protein [Virgibacillus oceani]GGG65060.1 BMP family ABC transporter substrate-binding protein [Virgibacillus oceani]
MRRLLFIILIVLLSACSSVETTQTEDVFSVGLLLSDSGLGDGSFNDSAFRGLEKTRDELGIIFDYREPVDQNFNGKLEELIKDDHDLVIGIGFTAAPAVNELADKYPKQQFALVDAVSDKKNVISITFKEEEGSYLIGLIAGLKTKTNVVGFIGGEDVPLIHNFEQGFKDGVKAVNKDATVLTEYAGTFGDDQIGAKIASKQIEKDADFIFPAAGFTGIGVLKEAQKEGIYAFGVDSDQFYIAEKAVVTSMLKNVDVALYDVVKKLINEEGLTGEQLELGVKDNGIDLTPIRLIQLSNKEQSIIDKAMDKGE